MLTPTFGDHYKKINNKETNTERKRGKLVYLHKYITQETHTLIKETLTHSFHSIKHPTNF